MKPQLMIALISLALSGCLEGHDGNPDGEPYAGEPGGVYDAAANPPHTEGVVTYDPNAPLPPDRPAMSSGPTPTPYVAPIPNVPPPPNGAPTR